MRINRKSIKFAAIYTVLALLLLLIGYMTWAEIVLVLGLIVMFA